MRLNRGSLIFLALLIIVMVVSYILLQSGGEDSNNTPTAVATSATVRIFPSVLAPNVQTISIQSTEEVSDTRPTPIPGNPTLEPATDVPEGESVPTTTTTLSLMRDATGDWVAGADNTVDLTATIDPVRLESSLTTLAGLQSTLQFTPEDGNYAQFGLDNPTHVITFTATEPTGSATPTGENTAQTYSLRLGNQTVSEDGFYALLNDDATTVYVISNAAQIRSQLLNIVDAPPLQPTAVPTAAPVLNVPGLIFQNFLLGNATGFTFTNNATGDVIEIGRTVDNTAWTYSVNGTPITIDQVELDIALNRFASIIGVSRADETAPSAVGLDVPTYTLIARDSLSTYTLQLGQQDPTGAIYYGLVDAFETVVLVDATSVSPLINLFDAPPVPVEVTPEATAPVTAPEVTPEATDESEINTNVLDNIAESTEDAMEATEEPVAEATEMMVSEPVVNIEDIELDNVTSVSISSVIGEEITTLSLIRDEEGESWLFSDDTTFEVTGEVEDTQADFAIFTLLSLDTEATTDVELAEVSLDVPVYDILLTADVALDDESDETETVTYRLRLGATTEDGEAYYALLNDDETIYIVDDASAIDNVVLELLAELSTPATGEEQ